MTFSMKTKKCMEPIDIQSQDKMSMILTSLADSQTRVLGLFVRLNCIQIIQLTYFDLMCALIPGHHTELAAATTMAFSAR